VANAILYDTVANVAAIPASPANNDAVEVVNSTGIESFSPLSGKPAGFVGDSGLSVRIVYTTAGSTWNWIQYFPNDPENRYGDAITTLQTDLSQAETDILALDSAKLDASTAASTYLTQSNAASTYLTQSNAASTYQTQSGMSSYLTTTAAGTTYAPLASPTFTGTVTIPAGASISGYLTTANAASTYQTQAGMSSYVPTSAIGTTVQSYDADTAKTDVAQTFTAAQRGAYVTLTDAATIATDLSLGNQFQVTLGGNRTLGAPTNVVAGQSGVIRVVQDGTGSRTLAYNSVFKFPGGTAPTLTTTANAVDLLAYHVESTTRIAVRFIGDVK
jgi:putative hemolysin